MTVCIFVHASRIYRTKVWCNCANNIHAMDIGIGSALPNLDVATLLQFINCKASISVERSFEKFHQSTGAYSWEHFIGNIIR